MRTHLQFRSAAFPAYPEEDELINPGRYGKRLAQYLEQELPKRGFPVLSIGTEDWGWMVELANIQFPLWIGCGNYEEYDDGFLCFIEPSKPFVGRFFKRIPTAETVDRLANALEEAIRDSGQAKDLQWWSDADSGRK